MNETTKRLVSIAFVMMCVTTTVSFAQTAEYTTLLNKAKEYESKKEYVYALGFYYDAMACDAENAQEAYEMYSKLSETIRDGKPGFGEFNIFATHSGWLSILQNAEKYWTEYCPLLIKFDNLLLGEVNYSNKTASYKIKIDAEVSPKYKQIMTETIVKGLGNAWKSDWEDTIPQTWPIKSVYQKTDTTKLQNSSALYLIDDMVRTAWNVTVKIWPQYDGKLLPHERALGAGFGLNEYESWKLVHSGEVTVYSLYDLKFNVVDENGSILFKSDRFLIQPDGGTYIFNGIPQNVIENMILEKSKIKPVALYLEYGKYNKADDKSGRTFIKNCPEIEIALEKVGFKLSPSDDTPVDAVAHFENLQNLKIAEQQRIEEEKRIAEEAKIAEQHRLEEEQRLAEEAKIAEQQRVEKEKRDTEIARRDEHERKFLSSTNKTQTDGFVAVRGGYYHYQGQIYNPYSSRNTFDEWKKCTVASFYICTTTTSQKEWNSIMKPDSRNNKDKPIENVTLYDILIFCNKLSEQNNLTPCYAINGSTDAITNAVEGTNFYSKNITCDFSANGYRLPTEVEWGYAAKAGRVPRTPTPTSYYIPDSVKEICLNWENFYDEINNTNEAISKAGYINIDTYYKLGGKKEHYDYNNNNAKQYKGINFRLVRNAI